MTLPEKRYETFVEFVILKRISIDFLGNGGLEKSSINRKAKFVIKKYFPWGKSISEIREFGKGS